MGRPDLGRHGLLTRYPDAPRFSPQTQQDLAPASPRAKARANIDALRTLRRLQVQDRPAIAEEQQILACWAGWGALSEPMFGANPNHARNYADERAALAELMTPDEINAAARNTLNAHYTDAAIVQQMWTALRDLGFDGGQVLEPGSGAGTFMGFAPATAQMVGVELDPVTATISQYLYPSATVVATGLQEFAVPEGTFDAVIGNVPFGAYAPYDKVYNPARRHSLHNYAIIKSLALTRPGGIEIVLSSSWTLDAVDDSARRAIADRADLIGAVRLPSGAHRAAAGTEVVTDLLVLHRRAAGRPPAAGSWAGVEQIGVDDEGRRITVNRHFLEHPARVLGGMTIGLGLHGRRELVVTGDLSGLPGQLRAALAGVVQDAHQTQQVYTPRPGGESARPVIDILTCQSDLPEGHLSHHDGQFQVIRQGKPVDIRVPRTHIARLRKLLELRDIAHALLDEDRATVEETPTARELRARLNSRYDAYVAVHGPVNHSRWVRSSPQDILLDRPRRGVSVDQLQPMDIIRWSGSGRGGKSRRAVVTAQEDDGGVQVAIIGAQGSERQDRLRSTSVDVLGQRIERVRLARQTPPALELDPRAALVYALESYSAETDTATKGSLLTQRAVRRKADPGTVDEPDDAVALALDQDGHINLARIATLMGLDQETARTRLAGKVFTDPATDRLVSREEYLSGDVRRKLREAQALLASNPALADNIEALTGALPEWVTSDRIKATPGASWIEPDYVQAFLAETLDDPAVRVRRFGGASWEVTSPRAGNKSDHLINVEWGTPDRSAYQIMDGLLHRTTHRITRTDPVTGSVLVDADATKAANDQAEKMLGRFREWIWENPERAEQAEQSYNDTFNALVKRSYSTRAMHPDGMSEALELYGHQTAGVRRILNEEGVILAHDVGAGKTFTVATAAMELTRLGLAAKPMIVVPNHLKEQWQREFLTAFPGARVLAASTDDINATGRAEFLARAAAGDWDAIIVTQQAFQAIPLSTDNHRAYIEQHLDQMRDMIAAAQAAGSEDKTIKELERQLASREEKLRRKLDTRKDDGLTFERIGTSYVFVDEADAYKNLERLSNTPEALEGSDLAFDLDMKLGYLRQINETGRVVTLATATPVANSISETHTMLKYARPDLLADAGMVDFDTFLANFAKNEVRFEMSPTGGWVPKDRIRGFHNASGLIRLWIQTTDAKDAADLDLDVPDVDGGRPENIIAPKSDWLDTVYMPRLAARALETRTQRRRKGADNMAVITNDGVAASLDPRMVGGPDIGEISKLHIAATRITEIYDETVDNRYDDPATGLEHPRPGAVQFVFMDMGTPGASKRYQDRLDRVAASTDDDGPSAPVGDTIGFEAYEELKAKLTTLGVPAGKIVFIHDAKGKDSRKADIFRRARSGDIAVLIGSTQLMGAGTNAQDRAVAIHHVDCPYRPRDLQQRNGRVVRYKNQNGTIRILQYATEGSLDVRKWEAVERKAGPIRALMGGNVTVDEIEEISDDVLSYAEMKAMSSGNRTLVDQATTDLAYKDAAAARRNFHRAQDNARYTVSSGAYRQAAATQHLAVLDEAIPRLRRLDGGGYTVEIGPTRATVAKRAEANAAIGRIVQMAHAGGRGREDGDSVAVGLFGGLEVRAQATYDTRQSTTVVRLWFPALPESQLDIVRHVEIDKANYVGRISNHLDQLPERRDLVAARIIEIRRNIENAEKVLGREFAGEARYKALATRSSRLAALLAWEAGEARPNEPVPPHLADDPTEVVAVLGALRAGSDQAADDRPAPTSLRNITPAGERIPRVNSWMQRRHQMEVPSSARSDSAPLDREPLPDTKDDARRKPQRGQRIGQITTRPTDAGLIQIFETVHGRRIGETSDRILFTVQPTNDGRWAVYAATSEDPLDVWTRKDEAQQWALHRARDTQGETSTALAGTRGTASDASSPPSGTAAPVDPHPQHADPPATAPLETTAGSRNPDSDQAASPTGAPKSRARHVLATEPTGEEDERKRTSFRPGVDDVSPVGLVYSPRGPYQYAWQETTYRPSPAALHEADYAGQMAADDGEDPGFRIEGQSIVVTDPHQARFILDGVHQTNSDNATGASERGEKARFRARAQGLRRLMDDIAADQSRYFSAPPAGHREAIAEPTARRVLVTVRVNDDGIADIAAQPSRDPGWAGTARQDLQGRGWLVTNPAGDSLGYSPDRLSAVVLLAEHHEDVHDLDARIQRHDGTLIAHQMIDRSAARTVDDTETAAPAAAPESKEAQAADLVLDRAALTRALDLVRERLPEGQTAVLQTSDQEMSGFVLRDVILADGRRLSDTDPVLMAQIEEAVWDDLSLLQWDGVVGEDQRGHAEMPLPTPVSQHSPTQLSPRPSRSGPDQPDPDPDPPSAGAIVAGEGPEPSETPPETSTTADQPPGEVGSAFQDDDAHIPDAEDEATMTATTPAPGAPTTTSIVIEHTAARTPAADRGDDPVRPNPDGDVADRSETTETAHTAAAPGQPQLTTGPDDTLPLDLHQVGDRPPATEADDMEIRDEVHQTDPIGRTDLTLVEADATDAPYGPSEEQSIDQTLFTGAGADLEPGSPLSAPEYPSDQAALVDHRVEVVAGREPDTQPLPILPDEITVAEPSPAEVDALYAAIAAGEADIAPAGPLQEIAAGIIAAVQESATPDDRPTAADAFVLGELDHGAEQGLADEFRRDRVTQDQVSAAQQDQAHQPEPTQALAGATGEARPMTPAEITRAQVHLNQTAPIRPLTAGELHEKIMLATVLASDDLARLRAGLSSTGDDIDRAIYSGPRGAGRPSAAVRSFDAGMRYLESAYQAVARGGHELAGTPEWRQITHLWNRMQGVWDPVRRATTTCGSDAIDRWGARLQEAGARGAWKLAELSRRLELRLERSGRAGSWARRAAACMHAVAGEVAAHWRPAAPAGDSQPSHDSSLAADWDTLLADLSDLGQQMQAHFGGLDERLAKLSGAPLGGPDQVAGPTFVSTQPPERLGAALQAAVLAGRSSRSSSSPAAHGAGSRVNPAERTLPVRPDASPRR